MSKHCYLLFAACATSTLYCPSSPAFELFSQLLFFFTSRDIQLAIHLYNHQVLFAQCSPMALPECLSMKNQHLKVYFEIPPKASLRANVSSRHSQQGRHDSDGPYFMLSLFLYTRQSSQPQYTRLHTNQIMVQD